MKFLAWSFYGAIYLVVIRMIAAITIGVPAVGTTFFTLPTIELPGWMTGIRLGGAVTRERFFGSLRESLLIAGCLLLVGLLTSLIPPRSILKIFPKKFRTFSTALVIAISTYPQLISAISRIRRAQELRSGKKAPLFRIGAPLLEEALAKASLLAQSIYLRGFSDKTIQNDLPNVSLRNVSFSYSAPEKLVLKNIDLEVEAGDVVLLVGDTGCGKSTLLKLLAGINPHFSGGAISGELNIPRGEKLGYLPQSPVDLFFTESVKDEIYFAPENLGIPNPSESIKEFAKELGIESLFDRNISTLSGGEQQKVAIAAALSHSPNYLFLDEPLSQLDEKTAAEITIFLSKLNRDGTTLVIAEHQVEHWKDLTPRFIEVRDGTLIESQELPIDTYLPTSADSIHCFLGPIGSGKTTKLLSLLDESIPGYVPQNASEILFATSIRTECESNDVDWGLPLGSTFKHLTRFFTPDSEMHPRDLSEGQRLLLAISIATARRPQRIVLDEPTRGLDRKQVSKLLALLHELSQSSEIFLATHDRRFAEMTTSKITELEGAHV